MITAALSQLAVPYAWGKESPGKGFDCSGLVQWTYAQVGIALPRTSEEQYGAMTPVASTDAKPGDAVFSEFGAQGQSGPGHVGLYLGGNKFVDAPYTGVDVRVDSVPKGAVYGRPAGLILDSPTVAGGVATTPPSGSGGGSSSSSSAGCNGRSKGFNLDPASSLPLIGGAAPKINVGTACQLKALSGGLLIGAGGGVLLVGAVLIAAYGLSHTSAGRAVTGRYREAP